MNRLYVSLFIIATSVVAVGCDSVLDTKLDTDRTEEMIADDYSVLWNLGYASYSNVRNGFSTLDNNLMASVSDEAEQTLQESDAEIFNDGSWNSFNNPEDVYQEAYEGIRAANIFLEKSEGYESLLALNRDTLSDNGRQYRRDVQDIAWLRNEARVLRAYYHFELAKRYGGVPLITEPISITDNTHIERSSYDDIIDFVVSEIDQVQNRLQTDWASFDVERTGRITKGAALALKSRALLYAASPLNNPDNDASRWEEAAAAAHEVISLNQYSLDDDYRELFLGNNTSTSPETIWARHLGSTNSLERENYPIGTPGGNSGITPSHNLVSAYEYIDTPDPTDPFANRDPRLSYSIVTNNSNWNGRSIEIWEGGTDGHDRSQTSRTGYYLKKFLDPDLDLQRDESRLRSWVLIRYAEILLNYAEAMNEAFGPDADNGWGMTAREAVNTVRSRPGVEMPEVDAVDQAEMRDKIKHERRIELAFEEHRYWDLLRWEDAEVVLDQPLLGIRAEKDDDSITYHEVTVEDRSFVAPMMYRYPIPEAEISKSGGAIDQNPGW